ncbi:GDP-fucose protein O-fucosyltransferase 1-like [Watersipora subatra]|uniref:GDP-fucose protein O-fucosyltransferase 1-like n=1 Tax=Watersipora subatra TaxID=2589382 RepID=UPI00355B06CA
MIWTLLLIACSSFVAALSINVDTNGYILYCPCMGRFGNQADQFLGALNFAKQLNRTMVLPHWIEFDFTRGATSMQIPFNKYFKVEPLLKYHRVMLMQDFMDKLAPEIWPKGKRTVFCYRVRDITSTSKPNSCNAKDGNPFGPFWDFFNVDFDSDEFYAPLLWNERDFDQWRQKYPPHLWPVIAFTGAPAEFPVSEANAKLHRYLQWSDDMENKAQAVIESHLKRPFLGAHLRIGIDWQRSCRHMEDGKPQHLFSTAQCLGSRFEFGLPNREMCLPSVEATVMKIVSMVKKNSVKSVFLASDDQAYHADIVSSLKNISVPVYWLPSNHPHLDLAVLSKAEHFIGNCVSSFSAFAVRHRRVQDLPVNFWAFTRKPRDEL